MKIKINKISGHGFKFLILEKDQEVGRARLYVLNNDLHPEPFGFIEDVYIKEEHRGKGYGSKLMKLLIEKARECKCYKLICTSRFTRPEVHGFYKKLGLKKYGYEFRIDFE
jgi:GNAT superfamily N-acetyltransferase